MLSEPADGDLRVFVVGCDRSGTTLLRLMLDGNPQLAIPPESHFVLPALRWTPDPERRPDLVLLRDQLATSEWFDRWDLPLVEVEREWRNHPPGDLSQALRAVFRCYARRQGKELVGDKTPWYGTGIPTLAKAFPDARFVHIVRDGRDVALSFLDRDFPPHTLPHAVKRWRWRVLTASAAGVALGGKRYCEIRYEDLLDDPERVLRELCTFLDLEFSSQMLQYTERGRDVIRDYPQLHRHLVKPPTKGIRDWRTAMSAGDQDLFEALAGDVLSRYGYPLKGPPAALNARVVLALRLTQLRLVRRWQAERTRLARVAHLSRRRSRATT